MPARKKKIDVLITPKDANHALNYILEGLKFFLMKHTLKTVLALLLICGAPLYVVIQYYTTQKAKVGDAAPLSEVVKFDLTPQAFAGIPDNGLPIVIDGKTYGYYNPDFEVWKEAGSDRFLVHQKSTGKIKWVEVEELTKSLKF